MLQKFISSFACTVQFVGVCSFFDCFRSNISGIDLVVRVSLTFPPVLRFHSFHGHFFLHFLAEMILKVEMLFRKCVIVYVYI